ncbi:MAG: XRE family transcriptional regulator [Pseudomonadota bacterium]
MARAERHQLPNSLPPRGLPRQTAAAYIGVSVAMFDQMVKDGRMPGPKLINTKPVWDKARLDSAFDRLPEKDGEAEDDGWSDYQ